MSVKVVHKKWEIVKICLSIIEENNEIVRRLSPKERRKENLVWNEEDARNVEMLKVRNVRFLNLKNSKTKGSPK